jgi:hypothetical protein
METPRTTLAAAAGLRTGYGSGIFSTIDLPYKVLGHNGGIDGFLSTYAYSPSRDVGYVVLLNSTGSRAGDALRRISSMAIGYLKHDVDPPAKPAVRIDAAILDRYTGYYHDANPRNQFAWPVQSLFSGREIVRDADTLFEQPLIGDRVALVPVTDSMFRLERELEASRVFTTDADGRMVLTGPQLYAERTQRWPVDAVRILLAAAGAVIASVFFVAIVWVARLRRASPRGFWELKVALLLCPLILVLPIAGLSLTPMTHWGSRNTGTVAVWVGTLGVPVLSALICMLTVMSMRERASRWLVTYAGLVALAMAGISLYLSRHDMLGVRLWVY